MKCLKAHFVKGWVTRVWSSFPLPLWSSSSMSSTVHWIPSLLSSHLRNISGSRFLHMHRCPWTLLRWSPYPLIAHPPSYFPLSVPATPTSTLLSCCKLFLLPGVTFSSGRTPSSSDRFSFPEHVGQASAVTSLFPCLSPTQASAPGTPRAQ